MILTYLDDLAFCSIFGAGYSAGDGAAQCTVHTNSECDQNLTIIYQAQVPPSCFEVFFV